MSKQLPTTAEELKTLIDAEVAKATAKHEAELAKITKERDALSAAAAETTKTLTDKDKSIAELTLKVKAFEQSKDTDVTTVIAETVAATEKRLKAEFDSQTSALKAQLETLQSKEKEAALKELRVKLIADAGGEDVLLPSLVKGSTEEELKASIEYAKSIFAEAQARIKKAAPVTPPAPVASTATPPAAPAAPNEQPPAATVAPAAVPPVPPAAPTEGAPPATPTARPTRSQWAQQRSQVLGSLAGRYASPSAT